MATDLHPVEQFIHSLLLPWPPLHNDDGHQSVSQLAKITNIVLAMASESTNEKQCIPSFVGECHKT